MCVCVCVLVCLPCSRLNLLLIVLPEVNLISVIIACNTDTPSIFLGGKSAQTHKGLRRRPHLEVRVEARGECETCRGV